MVFHLYPLWDVLIKVNTWERSLKSLSNIPIQMSLYLSTSLIKNKQTKKPLRNSFSLMFCWESERIIFVKPISLISPSFSRLNSSLNTTCL